MGMGKQKIILQVNMSCEKCRKKAKKITAVTQGVTLLAIEGEDRMVVVGEGIDSVSLVTSLRKKVKYANIISIETKDADKEKNEGEKRKKGQEDQKNNMILWELPGYGCYYAPPPPPGFDAVLHGNSAFPNSWFTW